LTWHESIDEGCIIKAPRKKVLRFLVAASSGVLGAYISFKLFSFAYIEWACWRYPHNNSMAGFAAFMYGIPIGTLCGILLFCLVLFWNKTGPWPENLSPKK
jgi:hypothetical protein